MATEVQWSELQRDPRSVAALADEGDVRVRRRDGAALLLTREDRASAAARSLLDEFPWVDGLPADDRRQFVADFARAFQASVGDDLGPVPHPTVHDLAAAAGTGKQCHIPAV